MNANVSGAIAAIRIAGDLLGEAAQQLPGADPGAAPFGAGGPGRLGEISRDLYLQWQQALDARAREAYDQAVRLHELADVTSGTARRFADANDSARSLHRDDDRHTPKGL
jgi:hypothetical protein